jgi:hypothetical protein
VLSYSLIVSRGYVRLLRQGQLPSRAWPAPLEPPPDWAVDEPEPIPDWVFDEASEKSGEDDWWVDAPEPLDPVLQAAIEEAMTVRRGDRGMTHRSRMNMRRLFVSLPWELLGSRPALISLTYPKNWQRWVPDGRVWERHRRVFERRWVRKWGEPLIGVWVKEFQASGRPHLHLYVGLPSLMSDDD